MVRDLYRAQRRAAEIERDPLLAAIVAGDRAAVDAAPKDGGGDVDALRAAEPQLVARVARNGWWWAVPLLVELGFPVVDEPDDGIGATPLQLAAGAGDLATVQLLVEHGADPARHDRRWDTDAKGWAEYFRRTDVADYLAGIEQ